LIRLLGDQCETRMEEDNALDPLSDRAICAEIGRAWQESEANDPTSRHEEGGYIVRNADRSLSIVRWLRGEQSGIMPPAMHGENRYDGREVVATFHTRPNPLVDELGREWKEGPSERDRRWHIRHKLRGYVVGQSFIYEIDEIGKIGELGRREEIL
jgi:hypothetical protein